MPTIALVLAGLAALLHVYFWLLEAVLFRRPFAHRTFGITDPAEVEILSFPMLNQGFYNLFLAVGTLVGVIGAGRGWEPQGSTLVVQDGREAVLDANQRVAGTFDTRPLPAAAEGIGTLAQSVRSNGGAGGLQLLGNVTAVLPEHAGRRLPGWPGAWG